MEYDDFITRVLERSGMDSRERAIDITQAALETLGERLERTVRRGVASQLPAELREMMLSRADGDQYQLQEFYQRVGARADTKYYDAAERATAVLGVLREAVSEGQMQEMLESLPSEYGRLFEGDVSGPGFPSLDRS